MQDRNVLELASRLASIADEYPHHVAIDALNIAVVLLRSGRDYGLSEISRPSVLTQSPQVVQGSPVAV